MRYEMIKSEVFDQSDIPHPTAQISHPRRGVRVSDYPTLEKGEIEK